ncbi:MAG: SMC-Scp complex subunit ScpB [Promethearchaeota archaeon]
MEENPNEKSSEEIEEIPDNDFNEENIEEFEEDSNEVGSNDSENEIESENIEELEIESEDIEEAEVNEDYDQEQELQPSEESMDEQQVEDDNIEIPDSSEDTLIEEKELELDEKALHRNFIEAALYAAGGPLTIEELSNKLEFPKKEVEILVNELAFDYLERTTSLIIAQIGDRYQMQIRPEYTERVSKFAKGGAIAERYLRTLTIIALKQPILKSMVIKLRGTGAYEHVKYLLDNDFIDAVKKGRSQELSTTDKYAEMFGLPKDKRLMKEVMIKQLGLEEGGTPVGYVEVDQSESVDEDHGEPMIESEQEEGEE